jgi:hypothetical protein
MTSTTTRIWMTTKTNVGRHPRTRLSKWICHRGWGRSFACAGCGLLHPRTRASTTYDIVQMTLLWYIVVTVPVRPVCSACGLCWTIP